MSDFNDKVIAEFRANEGKVGPPFEGASLLLLSSTGARSGQTRTSPMVYTPDGDRFLVYASKAGAPDNPDWYHNLKANPEATIEVGTERHEVVATELVGAERDRAWEANKAANPGFADYEAKTDRVIPVIALTPVG